MSGKSLANWMQGLIAEHDVGSKMQSISPRTMDQTRSLPLEEAVSSIQLNL